MAEKEEVKLQQCKSTFTVRGMIAGKEPATNNNGYKEGLVEKGKAKGKQYRSLRFTIKTSKENIIPVEIFGMEMDNAYFYSKSEKKSEKTPWAKRFMKAANGYELILPDYDLVERINTEFNDGDFVVVWGEIQYSTYETADNITKQQTKFAIKGVKKASEPIDFESNFEEQNDFTQGIVINEIELDNPAKKLFIHAYIINYGEKFVQTTFEVNTNNPNVDAEFLKNLKSLKFGDYIKVLGKIHYKSISEEINDGWGKKVIKEFKKALEVIAADGASFEKKKYKEEDFETVETSNDAPNWNTVAEKTANAVSTEEEKLPFDLSDDEE